MRQPTSTEIDEAVLAFYGAVTDADLTGMTTAVVESQLFMHCVATLIQRVSTQGSNHVFSNVASSMALMLAIGMGLERKRWEVGELERMYAASNVR